MFVEGVSIDLAEGFEVLWLIFLILFDDFNHELSLLLLGDRHLLALWLIYCSSLTRGRSSLILTRFHHLFFDLVGERLFYLTVLEFMLNLISYIAA